MSTSDDFIKIVYGFESLPCASLRLLNIWYFYFSGASFGSRERLQVVSKGESAGGMKHLTLRIGEKESSDINKIINPENAWIYIYKRESKNIILCVAHKKQ